MKRTHVTLWFVVFAILLIGCESNPLQPNSEESGFGDGTESYSANKAEFAADAVSVDPSRDLSIYAETQVYSAEVASETIDSSPNLQYLKAFDKKGQDAETGIDPGGNDTTHGGEGGDDPIGG